MIKEEISTTENWKQTLTLKYSRAFKINKVFKDWKDMILTKLGKLVWQNWENE
jgi:hypothetical protein